MNANITDAKLAKALKDMGAPRSLTTAQARFIARIINGQSNIDPDLILVSTLPEAGEFERGYNKAVEIMGRRLRESYGAVDTEIDFNNGTPARRSSARRTP